MIDYDPHRWLHHFFDIKGSMLRVITARVALVGSISVPVSYWHSQGHALDFPSTAHSLVSMALGMLLVFRTNASYDRFWEGRKLWGGMVNETRNLARSSASYMAAAPHVVAEVNRLTAAFPYACMHALRGQATLGAGARLLPEDQAKDLGQAQHIPLAVATQITQVLARAGKEGVVTDIVQMALDHNVQLLIDYQGGCERIHKTPLPFAYVVHLRRALILYCMALPFALVNTFGWWTIPTTVVLTYIFLGIEEIGVEIEDPFGMDDNDLPLETICQTIERNVTALDPTLQTGATP